MRKSRIFIAIVVLLLGIYLAPLPERHPEQDECSFGPVSNTRYRELLAEAKRRQASGWPHLSWDSAKVSILLNERFDDLGRDVMSVYERLAAMHAIARALGGDYRSTLDGIRNPYERALRGGGVVSYDYHVDLNRLGFFSPIRRQMRLIGHLVIRDGATVVRDKERSNIGDMQFTVIFPNLLENYTIIPRSGSPCPVIPDEDLVQRLWRG